VVEIPSHESHIPQGVTLSDIKCSRKLARLFVSQTGPEILTSSFYMQAHRRRVNGQHFCNTRHSSQNVPCGKFQVAYNLHQADSRLTRDHNTTISRPQ
jgi:hypothetical protein